MMLKIKAAAFSAAAVIGLAVIASAQVPARPDSARRGIEQGEMRHRRMEGMRRHRMGHGARGERGMHGARFGRGDIMRDLNLTDAQKTRIKAIHKKYQPQYKKLREDLQGQFKGQRGAQRDTSAAARQRFLEQREQFRQRAEAIRNQEQNEIRAVLTAEQRARIDARRAEQAKRLEDRARQLQDQAKRLRERRG